MSAALCFAWGFAEATFFFLVPDVAITFIALRSLAAGLRGTIAALIGALIGGALMYSWGHRAPDAARAFLTRVPAIHGHLLDNVREELDRRGLLAMMLGALRGTPYKIYAVEWGARRGSFAAFLLVSVPARYTRFLLSALVCGAMGPYVPAWFLALFWLVFYIFYFRKFGR